jgi:hypothetical protein
MPPKAYISPELLGGRSKGKAYISPKLLGGSKKSKGKAYISPKLLGGSKKSKGKPYISPKLLSKKAKKDKDVFYDAAPAPPPMPKNAGGRTAGGRPPSAKPKGPRRTKMSGYSQNGVTSSAMKSARSLAAIARSPAKGSAEAKARMARVRAYKHSKPSRRHQISISYAPKY